jgi:hypothetical protein
MLGGMVSASKFANQRLAASSSSSPPPFSPLSAPGVFDLEANKRVDVKNDAGVLVTRNPVRGRRLAMGRNIMVRVW